MCGICGELRFKDTAELQPIELMARSLRNRGPDAGGFFVQDRMALGHRRLSILDLSPTSQQPMIDPEMGLGIAFNGCIYNFRELREELEDLGYRFFSKGDTEVILKAYHAWGPSCVTRFYGMFTFALWERDSGRLVLARDRLGIKPLYLADVKGALRFASTLPALVAGGGVDISIDPEGLHNYMSFHAVVPAPRTILKGVRKLPPATLLTIEPDGTRREERYWQVAMGSAPDRVLSEDEWQEAVLESLAKAVRRRLVADVPTGVLLSGGLDSSLLVGLLAQQGHNDIKTFSIGFDAVNGVEGDEFKYSDLIARHYGTDHTRISIDASRTIDALPGAVRAMSEPMMSHDCVAFYLLSQEVSKSVTVVQSGQGADEVFGGYHWYQKLLHSNDPAEDYARVYFDRDHEEMTRALSPDYVSGDYSRAFIDDFFDDLGDASPVDKTLQIDTEIMLVDDPVKRVDNMTMAFALEARVPFLDHELVELAARIPADLKIRNGGKHVLKEAARRIIPAEVIDRPKGYFPVPALKYIKGPYLEFVRDTLQNRRALERGIFNPEYVQQLLDDPEGTLTPKGHSKLWQLFILENWLQTHEL